MKICCYLMLAVVRSADILEKSTLLRLGVRLLMKDAAVVLITANKTPKLCTTVGIRLVRDLNAVAYRY